MSCKENCKRPWLKQQNLDSLSAVYLAIGYCYEILKCWKKKRGLLFDRLILNSVNDIALSHKIDIIIPIPTRKDRITQLKGGPQQSIAKSISQRRKIPIVPALQQIGGRQQAKQDIFNRLLYPPNFIPIFTEMRKSLGKNVLLVDDFSTTKTTLMEAAKTLKQHGARSIHGFVLGYRPQLLPRGKFKR